MNNFFAVQMLQTGNNASEYKSGLLFLELALIAEMVSQIASVAVIHDQEEMFSVVEGTMHVD
jgi:hypothetical protein